MRTTDNYAFFWRGEFSNFFPCEFTLWWKKFNCSEQAYMYAKALIFDDKESAALILKAKTAREAKDLGRQVKGFDQAKWDKYKVPMMVAAVREKFVQNPKLKRLLFSYPGKAFVEASPYDIIWGVGLAEEDPLIDDPANWKGENLLGKVLDEVRQQLLEENGTAGVNL